MARRCHPRRPARRWNAPLEPPVQLSAAHARARGPCRTVTRAGLLPPQVRQERLVDIILPWLDRYLGAVR